MKTDFVNLHLKALGYAFVSRIFYLVLGILVSNILPQFDSSALLEIDGQHSMLKTAFLKWDAVYFQAIATEGYRMENQFAFFPLMPILISRVAIGGRPV